MDTKFLDEVCQIAVAAGRRVERIRAEGLSAATKDDRSPVTRADYEADSLLRERLLALEPIGWLSEETADDESRLDQTRLWVVDPLDGTREFIEGLPEYTIAIGLVEDGEAVLGVVHNSATGDLFAATRGQGATRNGEPIRVAERHELLASRSELKRGEFEPFHDLWNVRPMGSIEYKLALVAAGQAGVTFSRGPKHEWDVCAGALVVEEAGGVATDLFGDDLRYNRPFPKVKGILAGAPRAHERALEQLQEIGASDRMREMEE